MAIPVIQAGFTSQQNQASSTISITKPTGLVSGDLCIIFTTNDSTGGSAQWDDSTNKPIDSGAREFTFINWAGLGGTVDAHAAAFWRIITGDEVWPITSTSASSADQIAFAIRITGAHATVPIDVVGADYTGVQTDATHPITGLTSGVADTLVLYILGFDGGDGTPMSVSGTGWVQKDEETSDVAETNMASGSWGARDLATQGASGDATVTPNVTDGAAGFQFSIAPGAGGATEEHFLTLLGAGT